jgi:hypothetical protein
MAFLVRAALLGCQDAAVMIFAPYPGSADFERLLEEKKLEMSEDYYYLALTRSGRSSRTYNPRMTTRQLLFAQYGMLIAFYATSYLRRPWRFLSVVRALFTGQENTQLDQLLRTKLRSKPPDAPAGRAAGSLGSHRPPARTGPAPILAPPAPEAASPPGPAATAP